MSEILLIEQALNEANDIKSSSITAKYGLGQTITTIDENNDVREYIYVKAGADLTAKDTVMVNPGFVAVAPSTSSSTFNISFCKNYRCSKYRCSRW